MPSKDQKDQKDQIEQGNRFQPRFTADGLIPCIVTRAGTKDVLMMAYMNAEALEKTLATGQAWYWSRSRNALWRKGATSGQTQTIVHMYTDCDQDTLWIEVQVGGDGGVCHVGYPSCFYREIIGKKDGSAAHLAFTEKK